METAIDRFTGQIVTFKKLPGRDPQMVRVTFPPPVKGFQKITICIPTSEFNSQFTPVEDEE